MSGTRLTLNQLTEAEDVLKKFTSNVNYKKKAEEGIKLIEDIRLTKHWESEDKELDKKFDALDSIMLDIRGIRVNQQFQNMKDKEVPKITGKLEDVEDLQKQTAMLEKNSFATFKKSPAPQRKSFFKSLLCCFPCVGRDDSEANENTSLLGKKKTTGYTEIKTDWGNKKRGCW